MNNYVVITKTMQDGRTPENALYPDEWPLECEELVSLKECVEKHPGKPVFTIADYKQFSAGLALSEKFKPAPLLPVAPAKSWWKFWA